MAEEIRDTRGPVDLVFLISKLRDLNPNGHFDVRCQFAVPRIDIMPGLLRPPFDATAILTVAYSLCCISYTPQSALFLWYLRFTHPERETMHSVRAVQKNGVITRISCKGREP